MTVMFLGILVSTPSAICTGVSLVSCCFISSRLNLWKWSVCQAYGLSLWLPWKFLWSGFSGLWGM